MQNSQQLLPICAYNKQVFQVCFSPNCSQVCFVCSNMNCQCKALHQQCDKVDWIYITKKLNMDLIKHTPQFKSFSDKLDQLYQTTIKDITKSYDDFKIWRDDFGLTECQLSFLHLIEEGRFTELSSAKIYEIRKEIRTPSKIILKTENQLKEEAESINTYIEKLIEQLRGLYAQNKVIKEQKQDKYNDENKIQVVEQIKTKVNFAHKLLGLNENGSRFFTMINQGIIQKQLEKVLKKINLNQQSINENKKVTNETINNIKQAMVLKIEKLTETVAENTESINQKIKENSQKLKNQIITEVKVEKSEASLKIKLDIIKYKLITNVNVLFNFFKTSPSYILFQDSITILSQKLKGECLNKYLNLEQKLKLILQDYSANKLSSQKLNQQLSKLEEEIEQNRKEMDLKINMEAESIKINSISIFFTKKINKLNLLYKASQHNFQVSKFWDKCNGRTNTVTILKTQFGKIIGGYTPLAWNKSISGYQQDTTKQTFIFSITQKHKIPISKNQTYTLHHHASNGPLFGGGHDLYICDKANITGSSQGNIGYTYNNGEYTYNTQQAYKKWSGHSSGTGFLIQQWEVYEIIFE